jgi:hypothetical protein
MTSVVSRLRTAFLEREKLVSQVDEGHGIALAAKLEVEHSPVESKRLLNVADFDGDVIETDHARFLCFRHDS